VGSQKKSRLAAGPAHNNVVSEVSALSYGKRFLECTSSRVRSLADWGITNQNNSHDGFDKTDNI